MNNVSPVDTTIKYGAISGLSAFVFFVILWLMGTNPLGGGWSILGWVIPIVFTVMTIRDYRNKDLGGYITYGKGFRAGLLMAVFSGFLLSVLIYAFITFIGKNIIQMQIDDFYTNMEKVRGIISAEYYDMLIKNFESTKNYYNPANVAKSSFIMHFIGGLIVSLIVAGIYTRKAPATDTSDISDDADSNLN